MKTITFVRFALMLGAAFLFVKCSQSPKSDNATTDTAKQVDTTAVIKAEPFNVDVANSKVTWVGTKLTEKHNGTFDVKEGNLSVKGGKIVGGSFIIDIKSLKDLDIPADKPGNARLVKHLLGDDFFDAEKFPTSTFEVVSVEDYKAENGEEREKLDKEYTLADPTHMITGNLEMKGVKKSIKFPAKVTIADGSVTAEAKFNINRKDWGMNYGTDDSIKDKFIRPTVHIGLDIKAKK